MDSETPLLESLATVQNESALNPAWESYLDQVTGAKQTPTHNTPAQESYLDQVAGPKQTPTRHAPAWESYLARQ